MNILPLASPLAAKSDDRPVAALEQQAALPGATGKATTDGAPPSREDVSDAVKKINASMSVSAQSLEFSIDDDSKDIVVKVIDQDTREVVRQIPSKEALEIAKSLDKMRGLLIDQTA